jgi:hypothetical protein
MPRFRYPSLFSERVIRDIASFDVVAVFEAEHEPTAAGRTLERLAFYDPPTGTGRSTSPSGARMLPARFNADIRELQAVVHRRRVADMLKQAKSGPLDFQEWIADLEVAVRTDMRSAPLEIDRADLEITGPTLGHGNFGDVTQVGAREYPLAIVRDRWVPLTKYWGHGHPMCARPCMGCECVRVGVELYAGGSHRAVCRSARARCG